MTVKEMGPAPATGWAFFVKVLPKSFFMKVLLFAIVTVFSNSGVLPMSDTEDIPPTHPHFLLWEFIRKMGGVRKEDMEITRRTLGRIARPFFPGAEFVEEIEAKRAIAVQALELVDWLIAGIEFPTKADFRKDRLSDARLLGPPRPLPNKNLLAARAAVAAEAAARAETEHLRPQAPDEGPCSGGPACKAPEPS